MSNSGREVQTGNGHRRPPSDTDRLLDYVQGQFMTHRTEMFDLVGEVMAVKGRHELVKLGIVSLRLAGELDMWIEMARAALDANRGSELETSRHLAQEDRGRRALSEELKAKAAAQLSPLTTVYNVLKSTRDRAVQINRWVQVQQQTLRDQEFGEMFEQDADLTDMFDAPLDSTLSQARAA